MPSVFEDLPNEILFEIFEYTQLIDLAQGFWDLNQRLNRLIRSLQFLSLRLTQSRTYESIFFAQQIIRLVIVTLDRITLQIFPNLRTLIINWGQDDHLKEIRSEFLPNLVYLSLPLTFNPSSTVALTTEVFSNRFTQLRYVDLGRICLPLHSSWSQSPSLRSIKLVCLNINIIPRILRACLQLTHLQARIHGEHELDLSSLPILINHPLKHFIFHQPTTSTFVFDLTQIFSLTPNIQRLDLRLCTRSFVDLLGFLAEHLLELVRFTCHIIEYPNKEKHLEIDFLRNLHRSYHFIQCTLREDCFCLYTTTKQRMKNLPNNV